MAALSISVVSFVGMLVKHFARMRLCAQTILHLQPVTLSGTSEPDLKVEAKEDGQNVLRRRISNSATRRIAGASLWIGRY